MAEATPEQVDTPESIGKDPRAIVKRWTMELELADKAEQDWRKDAERVVKRYRGEKQVASESKKRDTYNILWANIETIRPTLYNSTPEPVVQLRYEGQQVAKCAAEVMRRALKYTVASQDFDQVLNLAVQDYLLPGRAVVAVKYVPTFDPSGSKSPEQSGEPGGDEEANARTDEVVFEEIQFELKNWKRFRRGPGDTWADVPWVAFELELTRDDCVDLFGEAIGNEVPLQEVQIGDDKRPSEDREKEELFKRAHVWLIWDKRGREVLYVCTSYHSKPCKVVQDEYNLTGFFNIPRPLYAIETSDSLVPVPEFLLYQTLADELDTLTNRLATITRAIRVRGAYPENLGEIENILESEELALTPVKNADEWAENGGLKNAIWLWPIDQLIEAAQALQVQREGVKQAIFESMAIADIMRGSSDPGETKGAQELKSRWGSLRLRRRQAEVQRYCRDLFSLAGELIASKFSLQTLQTITGLPFPTAEQKQAMQQQIQMAQQSGQAQQASPEMQQQAQQYMQWPTWEEIVQFLRQEAQRHFKIDVQTDSTIALQDAEDQQDMAAMMGAISQMLTEIMPLVQQQIVPFDVAKKLLQSVARKFRLGYELDDVFEQMKQPPPQDPMNDPKVKAATAVAQIKAQVDAKTQMDRTQADIAIQAHKTQSEAQREIAAVLPTMVKDILLQHLKNMGAVEVARIGAAVDNGQMMLDRETAQADREQAMLLQGGQQQHEAGMQANQQAGDAAMQAGQQSHDQSMQAGQQVGDAVMQGSQQQADAQAQQSDQQAAMQQAQAKPQGMDAMMARLDKLEKHVTKKKKVSVGRNPKTGRMEASIE